MKNNVDEKMNMENTRLFNLIMLMRTNDVDLRLYAQNEIKEYSEKVAALIKKYIKISLYQG